ncbi:DUF5071 domain-containing protein [Prosthecobacter sp.]|uniref:DUF5071 domain-containing protein n=1 Tax=Prosthecobacter sp. TaxID=1965333 RepID=UPI003784DF8D
MPSVNDASTHQLVPKHKSDNETARLAVQAGYPAVQPVLYDLLGWIQDFNWPVAHELFDFLASIGAPLAPHIRRVFSREDLSWHYGAIWLIRQSSELYSIFRADIHRIASFPTVAEHDERLDELCSDVIADCERPNPNDRCS